MQPIHLASDGVVRFKANPLVVRLLEVCRQYEFGLNELRDRQPARVTGDDWQQLAQLIGYSVSGFGDLSYADPHAVQQADAIAAELIREGKK